MINLKGAAALVLMAFLIGRYSAPEKVKTVTVQVEKKQVEKETNQEKITTEIQRKDGTKVTRTTVRNNSVSLSKETDSNKTESVITYSSNKYALSLMGGFSLKDLVPLWGLRGEIKLAGPVSASAWGLSNLSFGGDLTFRF